MGTLDNAKLHKDTIGATRKSYPLFRCPKCKEVGNIDLEQFYGRVSIICKFCEYHETRDWSKR